MNLGVAMVTISFYPSIGGAQTHTLRLSQKLRARGVDVFVVTRHLPGLARYEEIEGVPTYRVGDDTQGKVGAALGFIGGALAVLRQRRNSYQITHCHQMISPMTIGMAMRTLFGKKLVVNPHRSGGVGDIALLTRRRRVTGAVRLAAVRHLADAFISISQDIHGELRGIGIRDELICDIPNGVDPEHFRPSNSGERSALRAKLGLPEAPLAVFGGRLVPAKGLDILLDAWPQVLAQIPAARLAIVGDGTERAALEQRAADRGIAEQVIFTGGCDDLAPYLRAADLFVLPSRAEGLPVALLEAMACGLPCVATAVGGSVQLLDSTIGGRLVPPEQAPALAAGLVEALSTPAATGWGVRGRRRILEQYSLDAIAERYIALYQRLVHPPSRRAAQSSEAGRA